LNCFKDLGAGGARKMRHAPICRPWKMSVLDEPLRFDPSPTHVAPGKVTLVGAGPGNPELLTVKADRLIRQATLVLYDFLVGDEVLALLPPRAERICVGKRAGHHSFDQGAIVELAAAGTVGTAASHPIVHLRPRRQAQGWPPPRAVRGGCISAVQAAASCR
jgi:hypothetical protein